MSEPFPKPRHDMDGYETPGQRLDANQADPLAELARLVGKDDPFRTARQPTSNVARFPHRQPVEEPEAYDEYQDYDHAHGQHQDFEAPLRGSLDEHHHYDAAHDDLHFPAVDNTPEAFEPALGYPTANARGEAPPLNADLWAEGALPQSGPTGDLFQGNDEPAAEKRAPRHTMVVLAAVVALTAGGLGATFLMRDGSGMHLGNGTPPTILAADTPARVQSPDMTNGTNADGNTALLEKTGSDKVDNAKVVSNDEQPVDLNQLPKTGSGQAVNAGQGASSSPFPEPRKVKTVLIRPDGSVVGEAPQASAAAPETPVGMVLPAAAGGPTPAVESAATEPKASTPKSTARVSSTPSSQAGGASGTKPAAAAPRPAANPVAVAAAEADDETATVAATPGTWSVQLAAPPSEREAKEMSARLQKKFSSELGGLKPGIVKAEKEGKALYRVRVSNLSQSDASALCARLKAGGGSCFAVRN